MSGIAKVLILDDEEGVRKTISMSLEEFDIKVFTARNKKEAIEVINDEDIDVIVVDITIPDGNGLDMIGEIKRIYEVPPKIIIYSGYVQTVKDSLDKSTVDLILEKPVPVEQLAKTIKKFAEEQD